MFYDENFRKWHQHRQSLPWGVMNNELFLHVGAIKLLTQYVSEALATPKTPLHVTYVDFKKAFDSVDRSFMLCKLKVVGLPDKVIRAIWPIVRENFVQITTAECLSNSVTQNVGLV